MTTKKQLHQKLLRYYKDVHGDEPVEASTVAAWAIKNKLIEPPPPIDSATQLAEALAKSWREETRKDQTTGRPYRANHAVTVSEGGKQRTFWADIDKAPRPFVERALKQRREQIVGDCLQLSLDLDHYNSIHPEEEPILIPLDFTDDVAERKHLPPEDDDTPPPDVTHDA